MANIFPIDFEEKLTMAQDDYILFSDSEDWNKIKKAQYSNLKGEKGDKWDQWIQGIQWPQWPQGIQWIQWPQWEQGEQGIQWEQWPEWAKIESAVFSWDNIVFTDTDGDNVILEDAKTELRWPQGIQGVQWPQGEEWPQWEIWPQWETWATWARINSAAFSWNDIVFGETDWNTVTLTDAKTTLKWEQWDKWDKWDTWTAATISVWTTTTWAAWTSASVTNSWTSSAAVFNFTIPKWDKWDTGETWATWAAATITVGSTTTWEPWTSASVTNSWTSSAAIFDFTIPEWEKWDKGDTGTAATITVWSTTTWDAGTSASVVNSWTSSAAVLDFTIPKGDKWDTWNTWATGNGIASVTSSKSWKITTVTITETDGDVSSFTVSDWEDGEWAGDVLWPSSSTDWNVVLFDWATWKLIKDSTKQFTPAWIWALADSTKYWASITVSVDTTDYKITTTLKDQDWNTLGTAQVIDLPLESVVVSGSYDAVNKKVILTLENGNTVEFSVADLVSWLQSEITSSNKLDADLVDDSTSTNKFVTASNKTTWDWKQDKLIAWTNITIAADWKTISATDTTYSAASSSSLWLVKLGSDTVQSVAANAVTGTASRTYAMQVNGSWQLVVNVPWENTTYTASNFDIKDLADSTWLRTTWSNKQDALSTQTAYTSKGSATKVPQITTNTLGQVTGITEVTITQPTVNDWTLTITQNWTSKGTFTANQSSAATIALTDTTYESKTAASWWTDVSLVTTGEKYTWNNKQNALSTQTAYTSKWTATKVPTITTNTLWQVTGITETSISFPVSDVAFGSSWNGDTTNAPSKNAIYDVLGDVETLLAAL